MQRTTRREFLETTAGALAGTAILSRLAAARVSAEAPRLTIALRDSHLREIGEGGGWSAARAVGAEGLSLLVGDKLETENLSHPGGAYSLADEAGVKKLAEDAKAAEVSITALCLANRFDQRPEFELEWVTKVTRAAKALGVKAIRIDVVPRKLEGDAFLTFTIDILKKIVAATEDTGVAFGIENHGTMTNRPEFLDKIFDAVPSRRLGLTLDTANFYWFGFPLSRLYELYEKYATKVHHTHVKSIKYPEASRERQRAAGWEYAKYNCPIHEGDIDFKRVIETLLAGGYRNDLCIEDESLSKFPGPERQQVLAREVEHLKALRGAGAAGE